MDLKNWRAYVIEAFVPVVFILAMEYYLFFYITLHDIEVAKEHEIKNIQAKINKKMESMKPGKQKLFASYLTNVHNKIKDDYLSSIERRKVYRKKMELRNIAFVIITAIVVGYFVYRWKSHVEFNVIGIQAFVHTVLIGLFQVFFYYHVGSVYKYSQ